MSEVDDRYPVIQVAFETMNYPSEMITWLHVWLRQLRIRYRIESRDGDYAVLTLYGKRLDGRDAGDDE